MAFEEEYAQRASAVPSLHALLEGYPLSAGIFRELVANSDDAGATKQVFVLDQRNHSTVGLYSEGLAPSQGPALMAFNDAVIRSQDWQALSSIHDSSKGGDESKIGKYGVGFRSIFNMTDSPQILSGNHLAIFDPLCLHLATEGKKINLGHIISNFPNQLLPFGFFMVDGPISPFPGTVIRCPLRYAPSEISRQVVHGEIISDLFKEFIDQELEISCLFLKNIKCIEIYDVTPTATSKLATMTITRTPLHSTLFEATVELNGNQGSVKKEWLIIEKSFPRDEAVKMLLQQPGYDITTVTRTLQGAKFSPEVKIAVDITSEIRGRLFTHLPLPLFTGFPVHVHALFGIDTSRADLRRASVGLTPGSQDHIKVQWNTMLFQTFIPRTWSHLLEELVSRRLISDVFGLWPPARCSGELECYFAPLSGQLVDTLLAAKAAVWPVYELQSGQSTRFRSLEALVVAPPTERECVLQALTRVGLSLTRPPRYIFELLNSSEKHVRILDPEVAHRLFLDSDNVEKIAQAEESDKALLLDYMLSTKNILTICNLPLVPLANGQYVTVSNAPGIPVHTMLTRAEYDIFGLCDDTFIHLHRLPLHVADTLLESVSPSINVQRLTVPRIAESLSLYSNRLRSGASESRVDSGVVRWLSNFWEWFNTYEHKDELFPRIRDLPLLPSMKGLKTAESAIFKLRNEHHAYTMGYLALGVPFLPREFSEEAAHGVLQQQGITKLISDIPALLDSMAATHAPQLSQPHYESILKHMASVVDESINHDNIRGLRGLPLFPLLTSTISGSIATNWAAIPTGHSIRSVGRPRFVPVIDKISFVGLDNISPALVKFLEPSHPNPMSENDLVELAVENFTTQPEHLQLTLLRHITSHRNRIIQDIIHKLSKQAFVLAEDGVRRVPGEIVDPDSEVGRLYIGCPAHLPSSSCLEFVQCLKSLRLLRNQLNSKIVAERVGYISSRHTSEDACSIARTLLSLLGSSNLDFSQVKGVSEKKWLPTNRGLCSADECRHGALTPLALFDKVLGILEPVTISPSLQSALHWDEHPRIDVLIRQLDLLLGSEHGYDSIVEVVKEFGRRQWTDEDLASLKSTIRDREWIPTTRDILTDVKSAVFKHLPTMVNSGFHQIRTDLKAETLLQRMGCSDYPSARAILDKLYTLKKDSNPVDIVGTSTSLLRSLPDGISTMEERLELLIPDKESQLRRFSEIFYNDIGENYCLVNSDGHFIAHPSVDEPLVEKLGLTRLGLRYAELRNIGPNMGQAPIVTVTRTLGQYTPLQFLTEFLANAADAKATEFTVAVNLSVAVREAETLRVLAPATMAYLCGLPSLVVHNNAPFTPQDFDGICYTNVGGKVGRPDTIGEFGLGALTMYHFTDLAIIISGSRVLFLDPSKRHLPMKDCASIILPLRYVQQFYKDHLTPVDGLFDFNMSLDSYDGTLFVLPLRASGGAVDPIIHDFWSPKRIVSEILEPFRMYAGDCLLFTSIQTIGCVTRGGGGIVTPQWSFRAQKTPVTGLDTEYMVTDIVIIKSTDSRSTAHWKTVTMSCTKDQIPSEFQEEESLLRKPSFAGLAARLDSVSPEGRSFHFFSTLPLSTPTTLPMHVSASFRLSSDRRHIRLDRLGELQTKYNNWLLEELIPPIYLFFLEHLLTSEVADYRLRWPTDKADDISNHIVNSFYSSKYLKASKRFVFSSLYSPQVTLSPQEAVLDFNDIQSILEHLQPHRVVDLPSGPRELAAQAGLRRVDPDFIKSEVMRNPSRITSGDNFDMIQDVIHYLGCATDSNDILHELPILPIEDGSFGILDTRKTASVLYYLWKPKKNQARRHNFDEARFVHPKMNTKELDKFKLNICHLSAPTFKRFVEDKIASFPDREARVQWTDSFWDSWEEYTALKIKEDDIASFPLVPTVSPSPFASLEQCRNGDVLLVKGDSEKYSDLRACFRELDLPVVHVESGLVHETLRQILSRKGDFLPFTLQNVISAIKRKNIAIPELFRPLDDRLRNVFAEWARKNITGIQDDQIPIAQTLPIWWSAGGGLSRALRPMSEVQLLPENFTLQDAAVFIDGCVAEDAALTHLNAKRIVTEELPHRLVLPDVLDPDTTALLQYKQLYEKCASDCRRHLPVPTCAYTFQYAKDLFKREPLFTMVFPENSACFVHPVFEEFERHLIESGMQTEESLDMKTFKTCASKLDLNELAPAREVFRAFKDTLPTRVGNQPMTWRELDEIPFIPRRMDTERKLPDLDENEPGLEIPPVVTCLDPIVRPSELVEGEYEAVAWSQLGCFEVQPSKSVCAQYPDFGKPGFAVVMAHLQYLSNLTSLSVSQRRILLHDVKMVYKYMRDNLEHLKDNKDQPESKISTLRNEPLFLNIDGDEERLNWVKGSSLAIDCHLREGPVQGVRAFLRPFEEILESAGGLRVHHPSYNRKHDKQQSESGISSCFDRLRRENALTDVVFKVEPTEDVPDPEPLFAHRTFLAVSSEYFRNYLCADSQDTSTGCPLTIKSHYSWQCVRSFLDHIYTRCKEEQDFSLELLLEILDISKAYKVTDLFDWVQAEIVERRLLRPDTIHKIKAEAEKQQAEGLLNACAEYETANIEFIRQSNM